MNLHLPNLSFARSQRLNVILVCVFAVSCLVYIYFNELRNTGAERRYQYRLLANELALTSNELTHLARAYVLTGNPIYKQEYLSIQGILDSTKTLGSDELLVLVRRIPQVKFSEVQFRKLVASANSSTVTDMAAMALVESGSSDLNSRRIQAVQLLGDEDYQRRKLDALQPTQQFRDLGESRTQRAVSNAGENSNLLGLVCLLLAAGLLLSLRRTSTIMRMSLGGSLDDVHAQVMNIGNGHVTETMSIAPNVGGGLLGCLAKIQRDRSETEAALKKSDHELKRLSRLYEAIRHLNYAIVRCTNEQELFETICTAIVEHGGMKMAWIGLLDPQSGCIKPAASFGTGVEYLQGIQISVDSEEPSGQGPTGTAFRDGQPFWCQDFRSDPATTPWHARSSRFSWAANAALPLRRNGEIIGVVTTYAGEINAFDQPVQNLLVEMVSDMDYALRNFERETERKLTLAQREKSRQKDDLRSFMFERLISDSRLDQILADFVLKLERQFPNSPCSILLLDAQGKHLTVGAAPNLPDFYNKAIEGIPIGLNRGSCGTAVFSGQRVIVKDIASHPSWVDYKELADKAGLVACWSEPIRSGPEKILGTFAIYHRRQATPTLHEIDLIEMAARFASLAIERKRAESTLQLATKVFHQSSEVMAVTDKHNRIVRVNHAFTQITGYSEAEVLGRDPNLLGSGRHDSNFFKAMWAAIQKDGQWQGEIWNKRKDGTVYPEQLVVSVMRDSSGTVTSYASVGTDISRHKNDEDRIRRLVDFDPLTGLPNRLSLGQRAETELLYADRSGQPVVVMFLGLDRFKSINDSLGHHIGNKLLIQVAHRLKSTLREKDGVYRMGGDEFALLCPNLDAAAAALMASSVLEINTQAYSIDEQDLATTFSIGIAVYPTDGDSFEALSTSAHTAMYQAKQAGRNSYRFFTARMQAQSSRALQLENGLRRALELNQLHMVYQPQVSLHDNQVVGMEALLRWEHPTLGTVSPAEFIPVAEESGLILPIGEWVLRTATQQLRSWLDSGLTVNLISVNLSIVQFRHVNLPELITQVLLDAALPPQYLELELTEGVAMDDPLSAIAIMDKLSRTGVHLSLDDFGTGYSSLSYLKRFAVYKLKIDQSFVRDITEDPDDKAIVVTIIALARSMGFKTIAEGVETQGQLDFLREQGCDEVQGYFYSRPLLPAAFESFMRQRQST